tara:strand:- start:299 stop:400 length:102 start_codon:yes stop_codon:yes gene_type:complete
MVAQALKNGTKLVSKVLQVALLELVSKVLQVVQ